MISSMLPIAGAGCCAKTALCEARLATAAIASRRNALCGRSRLSSSTLPPPSALHVGPLVEAAVEDLARELVEQRGTRRSAPAGRQQPVAEQRHGEDHADHAATGNRHVHAVEVDPEADQLFFRELDEIVERVLDRRDDAAGFEDLGLEDAGGEEREQQPAL